MVIDFRRNKMTQNIEIMANLDSREELSEFANYLGIDYEDLYELKKTNKYEDIDFDDYSR